MTDLTPHDVAADTQLSYWTVMEYLRSGDLVGYRTSPGGPWRIQPQALADWKRRRTEAPHVADPYRIELRSARSEARYRRSGS